jgi:hypothetical protein
MSNDTNNETSQATTTANDAQAKLAALRAKIREEKEAAKTRSWEAKYAHVVAGSTRSGGLDNGKASHGVVCSIACEMCGAERTINKQDAFQVRWCVTCAVVAKKGRQQTKRAEKSAAKLTPEAIQAKMAELEAQLAAMSENKQAA